MTSSGTRKKIRVIRSHAKSSMNAAIGSAMTNHAPKEMCGASGKVIAKMRWRERFGGVPTSVAIPPAEQAYAIPSMIDTEKARVRPRPNCSSMRRMTASPTGTIMIAVAVFEIHMERKAAASMKPSTMRAGPPPTARMTQRAIRRCTSHFSIVSAIMKPPRKRTIVLLK